MITKEFIERAIAISGSNEPPLELPKVEGFSSTKVRRLLHELCTINPCHYLEVGTHIGSTFIPAIYGNNHVIATCVDNWTPHPVMAHHDRNTFVKNLLTHLGGDTQTIPLNVNIVEADMFTVDMVRIFGPVDVYFFDGPHDLEAQEQAFIHFNSIFADTFVAVVDDANYSAEVNVGTHNAFRHLGYKVEQEWNLKGDYNGSEAGYWNGLIVALIHK